MTGNPLLLVIVAGIMFAVLGGVTLLSHIYSLNGIKSKTVGDGQHGTARWATKAEIKKIYKHVPFDPQRWRKQAAKGETPTGDDGKPLPQGIVVGCTGNTTAMVDIRILICQVKLRARRKSQPRWKCLQHNSMP